MYRCWVISATRKYQAFGAVLLRERRSAAVVVVADCAFGASKITAHPCMGEGERDTLLTGFGGEQIADTWHDRHVAE